MGFCGRDSEMSGVINGWECSEQLNDGKSLRTLFWVLKLVVTRNYNNITNKSKIHPMTGHEGTEGE